MPAKTKTEAKKKGGKKPPVFIPCDPDEFIRSEKNPISWLKTHEKDGVIWKSDKLLTTVEENGDRSNIEDPVEKNQALMQVAGMLASMPDEMAVARDEYAKQIRNAYKVSKGTMDGIVKAALEAAANAKSRKDHRQRVQKNRVIKLNGSPVTWPFFTEEYAQDGNFKGIKINKLKFIELLKSFGYSRFQTEEGKEYQFVQIKENIITHCNRHDIIDHLEIFINKEYDFEKAKDIQFTDSEILLNKFYDGIRTYFNNELFARVKQEHEIILNSDLKDRMYFYYRNGFVEVTRNGYELKAYEEMNGSTWDHQVLERDFQKIKDFPEMAGNHGIFADFIYKLSGQETQRFIAFMTVIGYLCHDFYGYKLKAINFTDSRLSDVDDGRSGKTLLAKMLGRVRSYTEINGKDFNPRQREKYEKANLGTQIMHLNDVKANFPLEFIFNDITEGYMVKKLYMDPFRNKSKFIVSSNRTLNIEGGSQRDRIIPIEVSEYFSVDHSPEDEYEVWFPDNPEIDDNWSKEEWAKFDNFIALCGVHFLQKGIVIPASINLEERTLRNHTSEEFVEWMDDKLRDYKKAETLHEARFDKKELREEFWKAHSGSFSKKFESIFTARLFNKWLKRYAQLRLRIKNVHEFKTSGVQYITFKEHEG